MSKPTGVDCLVVGGGGHAAVVIDALVLAGTAARIGVVDADPAARGGDVLGQPVVLDDGYLPQAAGNGFTHFVVGVGGVRDNRARRALFEKALAAGLVPLTVVHPAATVSPHAELGDGTVVMAGAVVNARARLGVNAIVNTNAVIEHDCVVGDHCHAAPGSIVLGGAALGDGALIGAGATVMPGTKIGADALVGAGSVAVKDVRDGTVVLGAPAREKS